MLLEKDVLVNLNLMDKQEAEKNIELWKKHSNCLLHAEKRAWTWHSKNLALSWPSSMSSTVMVPFGPGLACIVNKLWEVAGRDLGMAGLWLASKYFTPKTKPRVKKTCREEEVVIRADDLLSFGGLDSCWRL